MSTLLINEDTDLFSTPKPERLIQRILQIVTNPGDSVILPRFWHNRCCRAQDGAALYRREMGDHRITHCVPRLRKVIDGEQGGISQAVNWQGGGGFRFYQLGEPALIATGESIRYSLCSPCRAYLVF